MPTNRGGLGLAVISGKIYAIGGSSSDGELAINEMFDPVTNKWYTKTPMPTARTGFAITTYENKIYVIGGSVGDSFLGNVEVYDPISNTWQTMASMPTPRADLSANIVDGKIYLIGGKTYSSVSPYYSQTSINQVYDVETNTWSTNVSMPTALQGYASTVIDKKIYFIGGTKQSVSGVDSSTNAVQIYDTQTANWTTGKPLNYPSSYGAAIATSGVLAPTKIYYIGGYSAGIFTNKTQIYDIEKNSWSEGPKMLTSRAYLGLAVVSDVVYAVGGFDGANWLNSNEEFKPVGYGKIPPTIEIVSPENKTYKSIQVDYSINKAVSWVGYSLDDTSNVTLTGTPEIYDLPDGEHVIVVYANDTLGNTGASQPVRFTIDNTAPNITVLTPLQQTYDTADVPLTFLLDEPATELSYSLDGQQEISIIGNITLPALPDGTHRIIVYAVDELGNSGSSVEVVFTITTFPIFWVATIIATTTILLSSGYLFFKRIKPEKNSSNQHAKKVDN
ncbi:MAG: kelch repeat-containing protein [Candidatus Bathyarchaeia archaeon]|jgi:N-acetylneuraminic acid mutarotase